MKFLKIFKNSLKEFVKNNPMEFSSSIAFYTIFSLPAILLITISIAGSAYETQVVQQSLIEQIETLFGSQSAAIVDKIIANASDLGNNLITRTIGIATLIFSATTVFGSLQNALNKIWGIKSKPKKGWLLYIINRLISLAMVISVGFLLMVSLVIDAVLTVFKDLLTQWISDASYYVVTTINLTISLGVVTFIFAMVFRFMPDARIKWRDVWVGAFVTTVLFTLGKYLIGFYLGNSSLGSSYGAAGSLVLLLIWVYYSSLIVLFGAQFTFEFTKSKGHLIKPSRYAVKVQEVEKEDDYVNT